ncbi:uncharacterized protein KR51_00006380 [Rubidibacter lacunae KORDI 51-2]|uniref:Curli production assembly/transport component CsgG n=1 Tax=Rubidibacter lacunae KORDI 51-2 TaxID=582515 RepID=U5DDR2_9CHRO|nr:CsgG/HfaB family protein [Rubidibacter lacunae]ERN42648.1 uncharacterized protein KR51_00006380 [Rubidibacter lacunae KORDI 51-2]
MTDSQRPSLKVAALLLAAGSIAFFIPAPVPNLRAESIRLAQVERKLRIAVLDFDFSSVSSPQLLNIFPGIAQGTSDILVTSLVADGTFSVIERSRINAVLAEQNFGTSGRVDASTAAEIGRILGVDTVLVGTVTQFDVQEERRGFRVPGVFGEKKTTTTANVQLNARLIDTSTAEILAVAEGTGESVQEDESTVVLGIGGGSETDNRQQLLTNATRQAVDEVVAAVAAAAGDVAASPTSAPLFVEAVVADVQGNVVVLNRGLNDGFRNGTIVSVERVTREVTDPETGAVLRRLTSEIGRMELYDVDRDSSLGRVISGASPQAGDVAKPLP